MKSQATKFWLASLNRISDLRFLDYGFCHVARVCFTALPSAGPATNRLCQRAERTAVRGRYRTTRTFLSDCRRGLGQDAHAHLSRRLSVGARNCSRPDFAADLHE